MPECVLASNLTAHRLNEVSGPAVLQGPRHCRGAGAVDGLQHDKQDSPDDWYAEGVTSGLLTEAEQTESMLCTGRSTQANDTMASSPSLPLASSCDHPRHHNQKGHYIAHINVAPQKNEIQHRPSLCKHQHREPSSRASVQQNRATNLHANAGEHLERFIVIEIVGARGPHNNSEPCLYSIADWESDVPWTSSAS